MEGSRKYHQIILKLLFLMIFLLKNGELYKKIKGHNSSVSCLVHHGDTIWSGSTDFSIRSWNKDVCIYSISYHFSSLSSPSLSLHFVFSFLVSRFSFLVSRFSFLVSRFSFLVSRFLLFRFLSTHTLSLSNKSLL